MASDNFSWIYQWSQFKQSFPFTIPGRNNEALPLQINISTNFPWMKINLTFHDTNNYKNDKNSSCAASICNETYNFRSECSFLIYIYRKNGRKNLNSNNFLGDNNRFKYYIIQQLFNDVNIVVIQESFLVLEFFHPV